MDTQEQTTEHIVVPGQPNSEEEGGEDYQESIVECSGDFNCDIVSHTLSGIFHKSHTKHPWYSYLPQLLQIITLLYCIVVGEDGELARLSCLLCHAIGMNYTDAIAHVRDQHGHRFGNVLTRSEISKKLRETKAWRMGKYAYEELRLVCYCCGIITGGEIGSIIHFGMHPSVMHMHNFCPYLDCLNPLYNNSLQEPYALHHGKTCHRMALRTQRFS
jgi:hypothetical protein